MSSTSNLHQTKLVRYVIEFADFGLIQMQVTINAAEYLGVNGGPVTCMNCHNNSQYGFIGDKWRGTGHYSDTERAFNGELSSHFREFCLELSLQQVMTQTQPQLTVVLMIMNLNSQTVYIQVSGII
ncbi:MAG: hypothetical protein U5K00_13375 [Melioribacteraceae bacterium]|nr:hypothetical protein [Melioribacteraceae bacterium]